MLYQKLDKLDLINRIDRDQPADNGDLLDHFKITVFYARSRGSFHTDPVNEHIVIDSFPSPFIPQGSQQLSRELQPRKLQIMDIL